MGTNHLLGLFSYKLIYKDKEELKVDFNYYPFPLIKKEMGDFFLNLAKSLEGEIFEE